MFVYSSIFLLIKCKLAMAYFKIISYIYFLFCLIFTIHTFLCVSIMIISTCSSRCFLFFLVWRQNNPIEEIKRGTKIALLSQLKLFYIIVRQGLVYVICFEMFSNGTRLFKCIPTCVTKMKVHKSLGLSQFHITQWTLLFLLIFVWFLLCFRKVWPILYI